jgi:hypothetical protein
MDDLPFKDTLARQDSFGVLLNRFLSLPNRTLHAVSIHCYRKIYDDLFLTHFEKVV